MGEVALITGGAGGLGKAFAHALLRSGRIIGIGILDIAGHDAFANELNQSYGKYSAYPVKCNVTDPDDVKRAYENVYYYYNNQLDIVINNAGIALSLFDDLERHIKVNLNGVIYGTKEAIRLMNPDGEMKGKGGTIINIASIAGIVPVEFSPVYAATKAGVVNFTRSLRWLHEAYNIRVNAICPNFVDTPMVHQQPEMELIVGMQPGGLLSPQKVAEAVELILQKTDLTGQVLIVTASKGIRIHDFGKGADSPMIPPDILKSMAKL